MRVAEVLRAEMNACDGVFDRVGYLGADQIDFFVDVSVFGLDV